MLSIQMTSSTVLRSSLQYPCLLVRIISGPHALDGPDPLTVCPLVETAFRQPKIHDDMELTAATFWTPTRHVYSRYTQPISTRVERVLSKVNVCVILNKNTLHISPNTVQQGYALTYSSGLAAGYAVSFHIFPMKPQLRRHDRL